MRPETYLTGTLSAHGEFVDLHLRGGGTLRLRDPDGVLADLDGAERTVLVAVGPTERLTRTDRPAGIRAVDGDRSAVVGTLEQFWKATAFGVTLSVGDTDLGVPLPSTGAGEDATAEAWTRVRERFDLIDGDRYRAVVGARASSVVPPERDLFRDPTVDGLAVRVEVDRGLVEDVTGQRLVDLGRELLHWEWLTVEFRWRGIRVGRFADLLQRQTDNVARLATAVADGETTTVHCAEQGSGGATVETDGDAAQVAFTWHDPEVPESGVRLSRAALLDALLDALRATDQIVTEVDPETAAALSIDERIARIE